MLGVTRFADACARSRPTLPDSAQAVRQRVGDIADGRGFCGDGVAAASPRAGIFKNSTTKIVGQQPGDTSPLAKHLFLNPVAIKEVKEFSAPRKGRGAEALLVLGEKAETTQVIRLVPTPMDYWVCTTFPREKRYRSWFLKKHHGPPLTECYRELAQKFPRGLAELPELPEELSGGVIAEGSR